MSAVHAFIEAEKTTYPVALLRRLLKVARSSFYAWQAGEQERRARRLARRAVSPVGGAGAAGRDAGGCVGAGLSAHRAGPGPSGPVRRGRGAMECREVVAAVGLAVVPVKIEGVRSKPARPASGSRQDGWDTSGAVRHHGVGGPRRARGLRC
ncbi:hypothetical protein GCM10010358_63470 [Streptomyces minutiscleroticus]|uniref:Uncharacterized protein n=1 Tax=Streptomyces minutiscleroticus TaxID=68238 RepID=A0A918U6P7_9ACTN|nr:hypothetical protein GCM10010358_63470 [Streptomyces minutiscleroticus]